MKKYSNSPIPAIVDLGDGRYEFCFNQGSETAAQQGDALIASDGIEHISYFADVVTVEGVPDKGNIITALVADGKTEAEAQELVENLTI